MDTFDPKPALEKYAGQPLTGKGEIVVRQGHPGPLMPAVFTFKKYGQSGMDVSEIFPERGRSTWTIWLSFAPCYGKSNDHVQAAYELTSGMIRMGFPSLGSWVTYGLGSENQNLPAFVVIYDARGGPFGGPSNWSAGFMPAAYQGTIFRASDNPIVDLKPPAEITPGRAARAARPARQVERDRRAQVSGQFGAGGADLVVRAGVSHAGLRPGSRGCESRESKPRASCTGWTTRSPSRSAASA